MHKHVTRLITLMLVLLIFVALFPACTSEDPLADNGFSSVTIHEKGEKVEATVTLGSELLETHKGSRAFLYELRPGDDISALSARDPLDSAKVRGSMDFEFPLKDGAYNRIYSAFVIVFNDGSLLDTAGYWIENPELLASNQSAFLWKNAPKGLFVEHTDTAAALGAMHVMHEVSLSSLVSGATPFDFGGMTYYLSESELARLDAEIAKATQAGMQCSLTIAIDTLLAADYSTALLDFLAARYAGGDYGTLSALFLKDTNAVSVEQMALLCRLANQALRSRVANGRVYVQTEESGISATKTFFAELDKSLSVGGPMYWGAAVDLSDADTKPWENAADPDLITPSTLPALKEFFTRSGQTNYIQWLAVSGISYSAADENLQAASFAYAYHSAANAGADLIFYAAEADDARGIYAADGTARHIESIFSSIDSGLGTADTTLCRDVIGEAWDTLDHDGISRMVVGGLPSVSESADIGQPFFDFSAGDTCGFLAVASTNPLSVQTVPDTDTHALRATITPSGSIADGGVRKVISDPSTLEEATSITFRLLSRGSFQKKTAITLKLEGVNALGSCVSYQSTVEIANRSWQVVDFRITSFLAQIDLSAPVVLTLTAEPTDESTAPFDLWIGQIGVTRIEKDYSTWIVLGVILGCVLLSTAIVLVSYRLISRRRRYGA